MSLGRPFPLLFSVQTNRLQTGSHQVSPSRSPRCPNSNKNNKTPPRSPRPVTLVTKVPFSRQKNASSIPHCVPPRRKNSAHLSHKLHQLRNTFIFKGLPHGTPAHKSPRAESPRTLTFPLRPNLNYSSVASHRCPTPSSLSLPPSAAPACGFAIFARNAPIACAFARWASTTAPSSKRSPTARPSSASSWAPGSPWGANYVNTSKSSHWRPNGESR
jgi:hypothetical protein